VLLPVLAACGSDDDEAAPPDSPSTTSDAVVPLPGVPGVTDTEIRFSAFGTKSNNPQGTCTLDC